MLGNIGPEYPLLLYTFCLRCFATVHFNAVFCYEFKILFHLVSNVLALLHVIK